MDKINKYIGNQIAEIRKKSDFTLESMAEFLEISTAQLEAYENGSENIPVNILWMIAGGLKTPVQNFFPN